MIIFCWYSVFKVFVGEVVDLWFDVICDCGVLVYFKDLLVK